MISRTFRKRLNVFTSHFVLTADVRKSLTLLRGKSHSELLASWDAVFIAVSKCHFSIILKTKSSKLFMRSVLLGLFSFFNARIVQTRSPTETPFNPSDLPLISVDLRVAS